MNNGPTKKQKSNSGEQVTPVKLKGDVPKSLIDMAHRFSTDIFMHTIKELGFKTLSMFHMLLNYHDRLVDEGLSETDKKLLSELRNKLLSATAKNTWKNLLIELNKMDPSIIVEAPAGHENDPFWYFRAVMQASHAIYQRQNKEIAFLKLNHPNHKDWAVIDTQDINANEVTLELLMTRHQQLDAFNESIIRSKIDLQSNILNLNHSRITRIPETLFHDESLAVYWKNVVNFNCRGNQLRHLPDSIGNLVALQELDCYYNQLRHLPDSIGNLAALQRFDCGNNFLQQLPDSIGNLAALQRLNCGDNSLQQLPDSIGNLMALQELLCHDNHLQQLPDTLGNLAALQRLYCSNNQLQQLPDSIGNLAALQNLNCCENQLRQLPDSIGNLAALQRFDCGDNRLQQLPDTIGNLAALQRFDCGKNRLQQLPNTIGNLAALQKLKCFCNQLQQLPDSIGNLTALQKLECFFNQLQQLPDSIGNLAALEVLSCHSNHLQQLPDSIGNLVALRTLICYYNHLQQLPNSIGNLVALQKFDCHNNQLQQLPDSIGNLAAMHELHCNNNRLRALPSALSHKFGNTWCRKTLANQNHHPISRPSILTQYTEATAQPQPGEKRAERTSEASASEEANDNADVLKRRKP